MIEAGGLPAADPVFHAGMDPVTGFEERQLLARGVGGEQLVAPAVGFFLDRKTVVKRLRDGRKVKAESGRHAVGEYRYGQQGTGKGRDRDAGPQEDEQRAIRRIVELRSEGASYRDIAATLDAEDLRPRRAKSWSSMTVRNIAVRESAAT